MEMHKERVLARTRAIFEEHGEVVGRRQYVPFDKGNAALHLTNAGAYTGVEAITRVFDGQNKYYQYYQYESTSIKFFNETEKLTVTSIQGEGKSGLIEGTKNLFSQVSVEYGPIDEHGEVVLFDPNIKVSHPQEGLHVYSTSDRTVDWRSGLDLIINDTEEADALTVRVDHDSKKLVFPNSLNIYQKLSDVEAQLRNGGTNGK